MKIAILTLRLHANYGGILQAYALMTVLKRLGHEPVLIYNQYFKPRSLLSRYWLYLTNLCKKFLLGQRNLEVFRERRYRRMSEVICSHTNRFVDQHIMPRTEAIVTERDWMSLQNKYQFDAYIVGSDQVWRPAYSNAVEHYFLSFLTDEAIPRVAYAASFGTDVWEFSEEQTMLCKRLLARFSAVSVREDSGVELCERYLGVSPKHVIDPTMLLSSVVYVELLREPLRPSAGLLVYVLDMNEKKKQMVKDIEKRFHECSFYVNNPDTENESVNCGGRIAPPVEDWLYGFATAKYVVTDSFHACVFSMLFHVPFFVIGNKKRGFTRILSLLKMFHLDQHMRYDADSQLISLSQIDWSEVDALLADYREQAKQFLIHSFIK